MLTIITGVLFMVSCAPDRDEPCRKAYTDTIAFPSTLSALFPYVLNDSSLFVTSTADTIRIYTDSVSNLAEMSAEVVNPECPPDSLAYKGKYLKLTNKLDSRAFSAAIFLLGKKENVEIWTGASYFNHPVSFFTQKQSNYFDSLVFAGITYRDVYQLASTTDTIYLNSSKGFIKIISGNKSWTLLQP